jgi:hypothetical protein
MLAALAQTLARCDRREEARALLGQLTPGATMRHVSPCLIAQVHAALGEPDLALAALERAAEERDPEIVFIGVRPAYAPLRSDPRFQALREKVGV